jgi:hypothetical protein
LCTWIVPLYALIKYTLLIKKVIIPHLEEGFWGSRA